MRAMSEKTKSKIKIYVSCHKECYVPENELLYPIQVGTSLTGNKISGSMSDNVGDNISKKNPRYCELTAQYWAWKNSDADYYGFMHYRRYFSFNAVQFPEDGWGEIAIPSLNDEVMEMLGLDEKNIQKLVEDYDVILPKARDLTGTVMGAPDTVYNQYAASDFQHSEDFDIAINIIEEKYPEFHDAIVEYINSNKAYECNMFIMKKEYFQEYSKWLFEVLQEVDKKIDYTNYSLEECRAVAFLGERLLGIWYTYILKNRVCRTLELQRVLIDSVEKIQINNTSNAIPIILYANDNSIYFTMILIKSIMEHCSSDNQFNICILNKNISQKNLSKIDSLIAECDNFIFTNINEKNCPDMKKTFTEPYLSEEECYRLMIPEIFVNLKKVIYLDSDIIVLTDLAQLYNINIESYALAGVHDIDIMGKYFKNPDLKKYLEQNIGLNSSWEYFQDGVLLLNLEKIREQYDTFELIKLAQQNIWQYGNQDVLNFAFKNQIYYLEQKWNVLTDWENEEDSHEKRIKYVPAELFKEYKCARITPNIIHYSGNQKPWDTPDMDMAEYFWENAKRSAIYEILLGKMIKKQVEKSHFNKGTTIETANQICEINSIAAENIEVPIYLDGVMIKAINKFNNKYPVGSKGRAHLRKFVKIFIRS